MARKIVLGIDTSNYTTSAALVSTDGELIANIKRPLPVKSGECGLRQSDAVFAHVKNLPFVMAEVREAVGDDTPVCVGVSTRPRNLEGSYMPCFLSGVSAAESIAATFNLPIYHFSHQCGHVMAAIYSSHSSDLLDREFMAFHVSGGTTELLRVNWTGDGFSTEKVGGTADLNAGQVIDRLGVHLGMPFPAGPHLEDSAKLCTARVPKRKVSVNGTYANLSGLENMAKELYAQTEDKALVAAFVLDYVGNTLLKICENYKEINGDSPFVFAGGVMCNGIIKSKLSTLGDVRFAEPLASADNAVGIAALALRKYLK